MSLAQQVRGTTGHYTERTFLDQAKEVVHKSVVPDDAVVPGSPTPLHSSQWSHIIRLYLEHRLTHTLKGVISTVGARHYWSLHKTHILRLGQGSCAQVCRT